MRDDVLGIDFNPCHGIEDGEGMVKVPAVRGLWESGIPTGRDLESPRVKDRKV